jgi:hypothetical protein
MEEEYTENGIKYVWSEFFGEWMPEDIAYASESQFEWSREK